MIIWQTWLISSISLLVLILKAQSSINAPKQAVLDLDGQKLESGLDYYILAAVGGAAGGGLSLSSRNGTFPVDVVQHRNYRRHGKSVNFCLPHDKNIRLPMSQETAIGDQDTLGHHGAIIYESTDLNIQFSDTPAVWKLNKADELGRRFVTIGGIAGHPGQSTVNNWFKIEKFGVYGYKIVHCPTVCDTCKTVCGDLGITIRNGRRWLALSKHHPLRVVFLRAGTI